MTVSLTALNSMEFKRQLGLSPLLTGHTDHRIGTWICTVSLLACALALRSRLYGYSGSATSRAVLICLHFALAFVHPFFREANYQGADLASHTTGNLCFRLAWCANKWRVFGAGIQTQISTSYQVPLQKSSSLSSNCQVFLWQCWQQCPQILKGETCKQQARAFPKVAHIEMAVSEGARHTALQTASCTAAVPQPAVCNATPILHSSSNHSVQCAALKFFKG